MNTLDRILLNSTSSSPNSFGQTPYVPTIGGFSTVLDESQGVSDFYTYLTLNPVETTTGTNRLYSGYVEGQVSSLEVNGFFGVNFRHYIVRDYDSDDNISFDLQANIPNSISSNLWNESVYNIQPIIASTSQNYQEVTVDLNSKWNFQLYLLPGFTSASISGLYYMF